MAGVCCWLILTRRGNATVGAGIDKDAVAASNYELLMGEANADAVRQQGLKAGFDVLPANGDLTAAEVGLMNIDEGRDKRLQSALAPLREDLRPYLDRLPAGP